MKWKIDKEEMSGGSIFKITQGLWCLTSYHILPSSTGYYRLMDAVRIVYYHGNARRYKRATDHDSLLHRLRKDRHL